MTVAYYHGAPGSYKTASMVRDWLIPAVEPVPLGLISRLMGKKPKPIKQRHIYTNIRGVTPSDFVHVVDNKQIIKSLFIIRGK